MPSRIARFAFAVANLLLVSLAGGHPMGNFSISHYSAIHLERNSLELRYLIDMAEIPAFQEMQQSGLSGRQDDALLSRYLPAKGGAFAQALHLSLNGRKIPLRLVSSSAIFPPGAGNLPTLKLAFSYRAAIAGACDQQHCLLDYRDDNFPGRAGWKEIVATAAPAVVIQSSTVPKHDRSASLGNYPVDLLNSPPQDLEARVQLQMPVETVSSRAPMQKPKTLQTDVARAPARLNPQPQPEALNWRVLSANRQPTPRNAFTELIHQQPTGIGMLLLAALIAASLGALHALEPGHGKTIVAAYLVGSKGTARHAFLLGLIVTTSHTAGVYLLGFITIYAQAYIVPERIYPFLAVLSGLLITGMGCYLALQRLVGVGYVHSHGPGGHVHAHAGFWHSHQYEGEHQHDPFPAQNDANDRPRTLPGRQLFLLGITGGIVPCPAALVVLLSAVALRRVMFGLFLIVAFSVGLAAVLIGMGLLAVYSRRILSRMPTEGRFIQQWLPLASAAIITMLGCGILVQGLISAGILPIRI